MYLFHWLASVIGVFIIVFTPFISWAGLPEEQPSSRSASLGYSTVGLSDGWSIFYNQAGLGLQEYPWAGVHHENRFISPELSFSAIGVFMPVKTGSLGVTFKRMGFSLYNETKAGLAYGMRLAPTLSAGVQLNVHHVFIAGEYGSTSAFTAEGGILYNPTSKLFVGVHIMNPTRSKIHEYGAVIQDNERIPTILNLGLAYRVSEMVLITTGVENNLDKKSSFKAGIEFIPIENLSFRTGMASDPSLISFGLGYQAGALQIDLAFTRHEYLNFTPHFSLAYVFGQQKKEVSPEQVLP